MTKEERERIAFESHAVALYVGGEIAAIRAAEEAAALRAAPPASPGGARDLAALNGLNVGAGGRPVHETLLMVDAHRGFGQSAAGKARRGPAYGSRLWKARRVGGGRHATMPCRPAQQPGVGRPPGVMPSADTCTRRLYTPLPAPEPFTAFPPVRPFRPLAPPACAAPI
jgi:hypothetical protein